MVSQTADREYSKNRLREENNCARGSRLERIGGCKQITYNLLSSCEIRSRSECAIFFHLESLSFHSKSVQRRHGTALIETLAEPCRRERNISRDNSELAPLNNYANAAADNRNSLPRLSRRLLREPHAVRLSQLRRMSFEFSRPLI